MAILELGKTSPSSNIPPEIIEVILSKLSSVKSLLRFKTVSKSWNTMISDPVFVETHLKSSNSLNNLFVRERRDTEKGFSMVKLEGRKFYGQEVLDGPSGFVYILCECNGMLLLGKRHPFLNRNYLLWNPSTRRERYLVCPYDDKDYFIPGICYDPITDDFKVVLIGVNNYAIHSSKNNSWTRKEGFFNDVVGDAGTFFDGSIYWVLWLNRTLTLVYFDPKTDELKRLDNPERLSDRHYSFFVSLRGSLCLSGNIRDDNDVIKHRIWIREEGNVGENLDKGRGECWKELITFENVPASFRYTLKPICFVENKILVSDCYLEYAYYSPSEKSFEKIVENCERFVQYRNSLYGTKMLANL